MLVARSLFIASKDTSLRKQLARPSSSFSSRLFGSLLLRLLAACRLSGMQLVGPSISLRGLLAACEAFWQLVRLSGSLWGFLAACEPFWQRIRPSVSLWGLLEAETLPLAIHPPGRRQFLNCFQNSWSASQTVEVPHKQLKCLTSSWSASQAAEVPPKQLKCLTSSWSVRQAVVKEYYHRK